MFGKMNNQIVMLRFDNDGAIQSAAVASSISSSSENNEAERRAIERDGHFTNGDLGYLDQDGFLFVTGRKRDMVISGGVNIYPAEIENVLMQFPEIADCAVFGIPDPEFGECVVAVVVPAEGCEPTAASVRAWLKPRVAAFKLPQLIDIRDSLPRESMGKVFKHVLRDSVVARQLGSAA